MEGPYGGGENRPFWPIFKGFKHILVSIIIAYYAQKNMLR